MALTTRRLKSPHRQRHEFPRPDLSCHAEENKLQKVFSARVDPVLKDEVSEFVREYGISVRDFTESALKREMQARKRKASRQKNPALKGAAI